MRFHTSLSLESFERKISESLERKISESLERKMPPIESLEREILNLKLENFGREKKKRKRMGENISFERKKNVHNINLLCYMNCQSLNFCLSLQTLMIWPKRKARVFFGNKCSSWGWSEATWGCQTSGSAGNATYTRQLSSIGWSWTLTWWWKMYGRGRSSWNKVTRRPIVKFQWISSFWNLKKNSSKIKSGFFEKGYIF